MGLRHFLARTYARGRAPLSRVRYSAIIDGSNNSLVTIGMYPPAMNFVSEILMDTLYVSDIAPTPEVHSVASTLPRKFPEWTWSVATNSFKRMSPDTVTEDARERAILATHKVHAVSRAIQRISHIRRKIDTGLAFQDRVYAEKEREARLLKNVDFDAKMALDTPFVAQYADDNGIPLKQAAEEILLQSELDRDHLVKTERVRLSVFNKIREATSPEELEKIVKSIPMGRI